MTDLPVLEFREPVQWAEWLEAHPDEQTGVWLKFAKKGTGVQTVNYAQTLDEALCFGWIDSVPQKLDEIYYLQKFTPRRPKSVWSLRNTKLVEQFIKDGRMRPAGQRAIDAAKADGRWDAAYAGQADFEMPDDFMKKLSKYPEGQAFYETLSRTNKFALYYRLQSAKKPETRAARMEKFITMLQKREKLY